MGTYDQQKTELVHEAVDIMKILDNKPDQFMLLRMYNRWFTKGIEFVSKHAKERKEEFVQLHEVNQDNLSSEHPDITLFKINLNKQLGTVEGSSDHSIKAYVI